MINQNHLNSLKHQNQELKQVAIETKKYAEKVKQENDLLKLQLEKASKKIKKVSKERGRREAQKDFKKFKAEFKKVIELNTNLQAQIESLSEYRMMKDSSPSTVNNGKETIVGNLMNSPGNINFEIFKTANNYRNHKALKENVNMYMTLNNKTPSQRSNKFTDENTVTNEFPNPPLVQRDDEESDNFFLSSLVDKNSDCNSSNNEIENIILSSDKDENIKKSRKKEYCEEIHFEINDHQSSEIKINKHQLHHCMIDKNNKVQNLSENKRNSSNSNIESTNEYMPFHFKDKDHHIIIDEESEEVSKMSQGEITPELNKRSSSSNFDDIFEGKFEHRPSYQSTCNESKKFIEDKEFFVANNP